MSVRLETAPDRGLKIRTFQPKSGCMATLKPTIKQTNILINHQDDSF